MIQLQDKTIIPIGCSCINQFQTEFHFGKERCRGSLFQWTITTPRATVEALEYARAGTLNQLFADKSQYELDNGHLRNRNFDGLYHWHDDGPAILRGESAHFENFAGKVAKIIGNTLAPSRGVWLLWSNIQPNLKGEIGNTQLDWDDFILTRDRQDAIKRAARAVFDEPNFVFIGRREDVEAGLWDEEDVVLMDLPRSDKFRGAKDLYQDIFRGITEEGRVCRPASRAKTGIRTGAAYSHH